MADERFPSDELAADETLLLLIFATAPAIARAELAAFVPSRRCPNS